MKAYSICLLISAVLCVTGAMANYYDPTPREGIAKFNETLAWKAPNMIYLGNFGNKGWYAFNDLVTQSIARGNCVNMGMKLGIIDSQAELEFIANAITEPLYHTDGNLLCRPSSFRWSTGLRELNPDLQITQGQFGLRLEKVSKRLQSPGGASPLSNYLCSTSLGSRDDKVMRDPAVMEGGTATEMRGSFERADNVVVSNQSVLALTYLGKYGDKSFYYDDALVLWPTAKENCEKMGMTFARIGSQAELEWILSVVPSGQTAQIWTDGEIKQGSEYWYWVSNGNNLASGITIFYPGWGLALIRGQRLLKVHSKTNPNHTFPYMCFIVNAI